MTTFKSLMVALTFGAALMAPSLASAVTTTFTEGGRDSGLGDFAIASADSSFIDPDLNDAGAFPGVAPAFGAGSGFRFLGDISNGASPTTDAFQFTFDSEFSLFLTGLSPSGPGSDATGLAFILQDLNDLLSPPGFAVGAVGPIFENIAAGTYGLSIFATGPGNPSASDYDLRASAVPLHASALFLLAGVGGLGLLGWRRRAAA